MGTKLERIAELSKENPNMVFTSIGHLINKELLTDCHRKMDGNKAVGIDGVTKEEYEKNLDANLEDLVSRLKRHSYKPKPARRVEIPKDNGKTRPLSIYCYEDKLIQEALKRVLEAVFEPHFYNEMMGFRPNRDCHMALQLLNEYIERYPTNWILDADIKSFFNHLDHEWIVKFIESRIKDPNIIRLVHRTLKAGIMENFQFEPTEEGSGQGSVCSPIIANIYMHYVLVWWFHERVKPIMKGFCELVVYADDFVACFQYKEDAEKFYMALRSRLEHFGLHLQEKKSRLIEFGRYAEENARKRGGKPDTFDFLGFTHYCSKSSNGRFRVKRKTSRKKFRKKLKEMNSLIKAKRHMPVNETIKWINKVLDGYYNYYAITDNIPTCANFLHWVRRILFYWLNRRSQRRSYTWKQFADLMVGFPLHTPKVKFSIYTGKIAY